MRLKIVTVGEPVLRARAQQLSREQILGAPIQQLIKHMRETVRDAPGVGLAAPQVGEPLQLAVIEDRAEYHKTLSDADLNQRNRRPVPFHVLINPVLEFLPLPGTRPPTFFEGCLSLPGYGALVPRAARVLVHCLDHRAKPRTIDASGWYARILQHEIDHLHGILYIDRMHARTFSSVENYARHGKDQDSADPAPSSPSNLVAPTLPAQRRRSS